ncbi:hypothetical protein [Rhodohalobacter mucosus]|uniref:hypothetical protein n=1 Tax=Rhodohalobacter mucosus TaxID=2079485 RepID=UPI0018EEAC57|nr:hypothetical protein [Rhodohalobacter mucosus]
MSGKKGKKNLAGKKNQGFLRGIFPVSLIALIRSERRFLLMIGLFFIVAGLTYQTPQIAMWIGFFFAAYSAIANDSIQTIGTFLASNAKTSWWILWLFIGGIFVITVSYSWIVYDGDVSYQRLTSKGFSEAPDEFKFLQVAAPLFLLILTRLRMPVSTTFLLLSAFATTPEGIVQMLTKSVSGYLVAFIVAIVVWLSLNRLMVKWFKGNPHPVWRPLQWVISGALWAVWLMQDAANIAVYLPRSLSVNGFLMFTGFVFFGLGLLFYLRGDKIQRIVTEKSDVADVRSATVIDGVYAVILWYFKTISVVPMSTTWVFIGLLAGREIAMSITDMGGKGRPYRHTYRLIVKDLTYAIIGLIISIALAIAINPVILDELLKVISG